MQHKRSSSLVCLCLSIATVAIAMFGLFGDNVMIGGVEGAAVVEHVCKPVCPNNEYCNKKSKCVKKSTHQPSVVVGDCQQGASFGQAGINECKAKKVGDPCAKEHGDGGTCTVVPSGPDGKHKGVNCCGFWGGASRGEAQAEEAALFVCLFLWIRCWTTDWTDFCIPFFWAQILCKLAGCKRVRNTNTYYIKNAIEILDKYINIYSSNHL